MPDIQTQPLRGADSIHDGEFEVGFDERFERSWRSVELVGRILLALVVAAGLAGLMGRGPFSHRSSATATGALAVDREPVARFGTSTMVTLHIDTSTFSPAHDWVVHLNGTFLEPMGLLQVEPQPIRQAADGSGVALTFALEPGQQQALVRIGLKPTGVGWQHMAARVGPEAIEWDQVVLP